MKKYISCLGLICVILSLSFLVSADELESSSKHRVSLVLPESLVAIEEEAFEGIAAEVVVFENSLLIIEDRAFADIPALEDVYVGRSVEYIAETAFSENDGLTIHGFKGSYAEDWAKRKKIPFSPLFPDYYFSTNRIQADKEVKAEYISVFLKKKQSAQRSLAVKREKNTMISMRPQDREELHAIEYRFP